MPKPLTKPPSKVLLRPPSKKLPKGEELKLRLKQAKALGISPSEVVLVSSEELARRKRAEGYLSVTAPIGRGVICLQWYQGKSGYIPTSEELSNYRTQFTPSLVDPASSKKWEIY